MLSIYVQAQTDKVYSITGDVIVGELKSMSRGVLVFDTDYADSDFKIDWDEVDGIEEAISNAISAFIGLGISLLIIIKGLIAANHLQENTISLFFS